MPRIAELMGIWRCERRGIGFIEMWKKGLGAVLVDSPLDVSETARSQEPSELYVYLKSATCSGKIMIGYTKVGGVYAY